MLMCYLNAIFHNQRMYRLICISQNYPLLSKNTPKNQTVVSQKPNKMNITLTSQYLMRIVGNRSAQWLLNINSAEQFTLAYIQPWLGLIAAMPNIVVLILCIIIYVKTSKKNHKPAFAYIGVLSLFGTITGWYVRFSKRSIGEKLRSSLS